ncbi:hypothetical protein, partial [Klebsiella pneumoniae]|uniref:hypothetical protein n=1 Tax=Klebsiella pneumoniae TaxID=573 RepID=UPI001D0E2139
SLSIGAFPPADGTCRPGSGAEPWSSRTAHVRPPLALRHPRPDPDLIYILIASAVLSWLVAFNVVNVRNPIVSQIGEFLY